MASTDTIVAYSLDDFYQTSGLGSHERAIGDYHFGIDYDQIRPAIPTSKYQQGYTFFVRPQLNLQDDNILNLRRFHGLRNRNAKSVQRYVRTMLDPRLMYGYGNGIYRKNKLNCPIVDPQLAFIPCLTNNITSVSGWPQGVLETFTSKPGLYGEVYVQVDSSGRQYGTFDIDINFKTMLGDTILLLFHVWHHYMAAVFEGILYPYPDFLIENTIDYQTRIFRIELDQTKTHVLSMQSTGPAIPLVDPVGALADFDINKPLVDQSKDITMRFRCTVFETLPDDILIDEFNRIIQIFNPSMKEGQRNKHMAKIEHHDRPLFRNRAYPRINPDTYEMEWWVWGDYYDFRKAKAKPLTDNIPFINK